MAAAETIDGRDNRILTVGNLSIRFRRRDETVAAVNGISFDVTRGETLCLVGESGSGKSATALALMRLLPPQAIERVSGRIGFEGRDLSGLTDQAMRRLCGDRIAMVFQEPMSSLNPLLTIGQQLEEAIVSHRRLGAGQRQARLLELLDLVGIDRPRERLDAYPHQLSGGQLQRVMIAMAIANEPDLLIADEPTTALDVTVQAQILGLLRRLKSQLGMTLLLITHDFRVVRAMADRVCVMRSGDIVEIGAVEEVMERPRHAYTRELLDAEPEARIPAPVDDGNLVTATDIAVRYPIHTRLLRRVRGHFTALHGADLSLRQGETLGVVGESGSGKSTLGRALLRLVPTEGRVIFEGRDLVTLPEAELRRQRRAIQMVFQDPYGSLSPRMRIGRIVGEGLRVNGLARDRGAHDRAVAEALADVELEPALARRFPHELSGGQRQRVAIARALIMRPKLIVLDEPTSALDRSVQKQIVLLLARLQREYRIAYLFISHDLAVVRALADHLLVLKEGRVVEAGRAETIFSAPRTDYTRALIEAAFDLEASTGGGAEAMAS
mgnify:CR=1 FL=1